MSPLHADYSRVELGDMSLPPFYLGVINIRDGLERHSRHRFDIYYLCMRLTIIGYLQSEDLKEFMI